VNALVGHGLLGVVVGCVAGAVFFGGLVLTVARLPVARRPELLVVGSFLARLAVVGATLLLVARCLPPVGVFGAALGVLLARTVLVRTAARGVAGSGHAVAAGPPRDRR
jgi:F1F0 ATPase subunit 2